MIALGTSLEEVVALMRSSAVEYCSATGLGLQSQVHNRKKYKVEAGEIKVVGTVSAPQKKRDG